MNIYSKKQRWKFTLLVTAILIVLASLWYTNVLVKKIAAEEREKVQLWAGAIQKKAKLVNYTTDLFNKIKNEERKRMEIWAEAAKKLATTDSDFDFYLMIVGSNTTIPVILTDEKNNINSCLNIDFVNCDNLRTLNENEKTRLLEELDLMRRSQQPIEIAYYKNRKNYLYYKDSNLFSELRMILDDLIKSFISEVVINSASVPVIYTDYTKKNIIAYGNIDSTKINDKEYIEETIAEMASQNAPIEVELDEEKNYIFYQESFLLTQLKYYPYIQFGIIGLFLIVAYTLFSTARKSEQNQVWLGMAKEAAHQLGTPLSSLIAWTELLKLKGIDPEITSEIEKDTKRLETITERFSKIGSVPALQKANIVEVLLNSIDYLKPRVSDKVKFTLKGNGRNGIFVPLNIPLFEWVIENLFKNAIDAMNGNGSIEINVSDQTQFVYIDITDSGKGIPKSKLKTIFEPGFTTKKRGWGLGLSLSRRIIENYHSGKIFVKRSEADKGTTFRIVLKK